MQHYLFDFTWAFHNSFLMSTSGNGRWWGRANFLHKNFLGTFKRLIRKGCFFSHSKQQYCNCYYFKNPVTWSQKSPFAYDPFFPKSRKAINSKIVLPSLSLPPVVLFLLLSRAPELSVNKLSGLQGPVRVQLPENCGEPQEFFDCQQAAWEASAPPTNDAKM